MSEDVVWIDVLPAMDKFGPALGSGADKAAVGAGKSAGGKFGLAMTAGVAAVAGGAVLATKALFDIGKEFDKMSDTIHIGTGAVGNDLDALVKSAKNVGTRVPADFDQIGTAIANFNTYVGATGAPLERLTTQVMEASRLLGEDGVKNSESFGKAMRQWGLDAEDGADLMDVMYVATQDYGVGLDKLTGHLERNSATLQNAGFSAEEAVGFFAQLEAGGIQVTRVMPGLNAAFRKWSEEGKNSREEMQRVAEAMKNAETDAEALNIATENFGAQGAQRLTTAIRSGVLELDDLTGAFADADGAIAASADETRSFEESWAIFQNTLKVLVEPAATAIFDLISRGMQWINDNATPWIDRMREAWENSEGPVGQVREVFDQVWSFLRSNLVPIFVTLVGYIRDNVIPFIGRLAGIAKDTLIPIFNDVWAMFREKVIPILKSVADFIVQRVAPVVKDFAERVAMPLFKAVGDAVSDMWKVAKPVLEFFYDILRDYVGPTIVWLWDKVVEPTFNFIGRTVKNVMNVISGIIKTVMSLIRGDWSGAWDGIKRVASAVWDQIRNVVSTAVNLLKTGVEGALKTMAAVVSGIWDGMKRVGSAAWNWIRDTSLGVFRKMRTSVEDTFGKMRDAVGRIWDGIKAKVKSPINVVIGFINKGVIGSYNWVADKLPGLKKLSNIQKLQDGGYVNRPWSATNRDPYLGMIGNGRGLLRFEGEEFIVNRRQARKHRRLLEAINAGDMHIPAFAGGGAVRPVPQRHSGWNGGRYRSGGYHGGLDFPAPTGTPVRAMWAGNVSRARHMNTSYGNHVIMNHGGGLQTLYAHMSSILTAVGRTLGAGGAIGRVGSTGNSTGPHLHLEVRRNGVRVNPGPYLSGASAGAGSPFAGVSASADATAENPFEKWLSDAMSKITGPFRDFQRDVGTGMIADIAKGVAGSVKGSIESWAKDKLNPLNWFGGYASGTVSASPGWSWVGERGPELVRFRGGERVMPHAESMRTIGGGRPLHIGQMNLQLPDWVKDAGDLFRFLESFELETHRS